MKLFFNGNRFGLVVLLILIFFNCFSQQSDPQKDLVLKQKVNSLTSLANSYRFKNLDSLSSLANRAYKLASEINYIPGLVESARLIAVENLIRGEYTKAIKLLLKEKLKVNPEIFPRETAVIDYYIGTAYSTSANFRASLPYLNKSLQRFRDLNDEYYLLQCLNNIGVCYIRLEQFEQALEIFNEIKAQKDDPEPGLTTTLLVNLGYCYYGLGEYSKAESVLNDLFSLPESDVDERGYGFAYFKLGEVYVKQNRTEKAIWAFNASISVFEKFKIEQDKIEALNGLAEVYLNQNDYSTAMRYAQEGVELAKRSGILPRLEQVLNTKYRILKAQNLLEQAIETFEELRIVSDSLVVTQQSAEMGRITAQYEFNQQRDSLLLLQNQAELENQAVQNRQQFTINIGITVLIAVVVLLAVMYRAYHLKLRSNRLLKEKNQEIEDQRDELEKANKIKNKLISIIGHDLRSPISSLNGLLYLVKNKMANQEDLESVLPKLIDNFDQTSTLLNNLLSWTTSQMEGYTLNFTDFDIKDVLTRVIEGAKLRLEDKSINLTFTGDSAIVHGEENMLEIVCHNLLSNAIKFCDEKDSIEITVIRSEQTCVSIKDTGVGISKNRIRILLDENNFSSTVGTQDEKGSGLGLTICKDFLEKNNSKLQIESTEGEGSTFFFYLDKVS